MSLPDTVVSRALAAPTRARIVRLLGAANRPRSAEEVAAELGLRINTVRGHLAQLVRVGLVVRAGVSRSGRGRPRGLFAVPTADVDDAEGGGQLATVLATEPERVAEDPARAAVYAGDRWAAASAQTGLGADPDGDADADLVQVTALLERLGFRPTRPASGPVIHLCRCPFATAARRNPMIVCGAHLGLLRDTFDRLGGRVCVTTLDSFVHDDQCVVHLRRAEPGPNGANCAGPA